MRVRGFWWVSGGRRWSARSRRRRAGGVYVAVAVRLRAARPEGGRPAAAARPAAGGRCAAGQGDRGRRIRGGLPAGRSPGADPDRRHPETRRALASTGAEAGAGRQAIDAVGASRRPEASAAREPGAVASRKRSTAFGTPGPGLADLHSEQRRERPLRRADQRAAVHPTGRKRNGRAQLRPALGDQESGGRAAYSTAETGWSESVGQFEDTQPASLRLLDRLRRRRHAYSSNEYGGIAWVQSSARDLPEPDPHPQRHRSTSTVPAWTATTGGSTTTASGWGTSRTRAGRICTRT